MSEYREMRFSQSCDIFFCETKDVPTNIFIAVFVFAIQGETYICLSLLHLYQAYLDIYMCTVRYSYRILH